MRVEFTNLGTEPPEKSKPGRAGQTGRAASGEVASGSASASAGADQARLQFDQTKVSSLETRVLAAPEVRQEKVEPLRLAVASGGYAVDAQRVANAMAAEMGGGRVR